MTASPDMKTYRFSQVDDRGQERHPLRSIYRALLRILVGLRSRCGVPPASAQRLKERGRIGKARRYGRSAVEFRLQLLALRFKQGQLADAARLISLLGWENALLLSLFRRLP